MILRVKRQPEQELDQLHLTYDERGIKRSRLVTEQEVLTDGLNNLLKPSLLEVALNIKEETTIKLQKLDLKRFICDLPTSNVPAHHKKVEESIKDRIEQDLVSKRKALRDKRLDERRKLI